MAAYLENMSKESENSPYHITKNLAEKKRNLNDSGNLVDEIAKDVDVIVKYVNVVTNHPNNYGKDSYRIHSILDSEYITSENVS
jgi:hypothetical protein